MTSVYRDADYLSAYKQKQKIWWTFMGITAVYVGLCIAMVVYRSSLPYASVKLGLPRWIVFVASAMYAVFIFPFMAIKFSRVRRYYKMLSYLSLGLKNEEKNYFYRFRENVLQKDNIDATSCVFETWSKKKSEWLDREAYFDAEKPLPPFESGDLVRYIVQGNFLLSYEIIEKKALEFEEVDESDEVGDGENLEETTEIEE